MKNDSNAKNLLFAILFAEIILFVLVVLPSRGMSYDYSSLFQDGPDVSVVQLSDKRFSLALDIVLPSLDNRNQNVDFIVTKFSSFYPWVDFSNVSEICISNLQIVSLGRGRFGDWNDYHEYFIEPVCKEQEINQGIIAGDNRYVNFDIKNMNWSGNYLIDNFYYPYDRFSYEIVAFVDYRVVGLNGEVIESGTTEPAIFITNITNSEWFVKVYQVEKISKIQIADDFVEISSYDKLLGRLQNSTGEAKSISISRPLFIKIIYPLLILLLGIFIGLLAILRNLDTFLGGALAIIFGIYSTRQIMVPGSLQLHSIVDVAILGLYVIFLSVTIVQMYRLERKVDAGKRIFPIRGKRKNRNI